MLNENFFPTPTALIDRMLEPLSHAYSGHRGLPYQSILEPSAGKGDIIDRLVERYEVKRTEVSCIEIEPELTMVLNGKGYRLIDTDFLRYDQRYVFDLVVMNPPFDTGAEHLLKAWEVLHHGDIVCLLNAETICNPYTAKRQLLAGIVEQHGRFELAGPAFKNAERPTDVEIAIVWLHKDRGDNSIGFDADNMSHDYRQYEEAFSASEIAPSNIIQSLVAQYTQAADLLVQIGQLQSKYRYYTQGIKADYEGAKGKRDYEIDKADRTLNEQLDALKTEFWRYVFNKTRIGRITTSNFQRTFEEFITQTSSISFTVENVMLVLQKFFFDRNDIMLQCVLEVFDKATAYHEKNVVHTEGWKTNKSWRIAPKIIMPWGIAFDPKYGQGYWSFHYGRESDFYSDLDKALCFLSGRQLDQIMTTGEAINRRTGELNSGRFGVGLIGPRHDEPFDSTFFTIRIFKKGTVHLIFKDADLLAQFNRVAAQGKKWVGAGY